MSTQIRAALPVLLAVSCGCGPQPVPQPAGDPARLEPVVVAPPARPFEGSLRLASIFPSVGRYAISGIQSSNGVKLAVAEINRQGGVQGRRIELLDYRTGSYFVDARHAAELAIAAGALALIGSNSSSLSMAVADLAESHGVVQISNVSTAQDLTWDPETGRNRRFVFRVCTSDVLMGSLLAEFARDHLGARRVAVLYEIGRAYSAKLARSFIDRFVDAQADRVAAEFTYLPLEVDFESQLEAVEGFGADVLFVPGSFSDSTLIAIQAERLGVRPILLGADGWSNHLLFRRGGPSRPAYHSDLCNPPAAFGARYASAFGESPEGCRAVLAHEAVQVAVAALKALGPLSDEELQAELGGSRERLREAVARVRLRGEVGSIGFDEHGDNRRGVAIMRISRGSDGRYRSDFHRQMGAR